MFLAQFSALFTIEQPGAPWIISNSNSGKVIHNQLFQGICLTYIYVQQTQRVVHNLSVSNKLSLPFIHACIKSYLCPYLQCRRWDTQLLYNADTIFSFIDFAIIPKNGSLRGSEIHGRFSFAGYNVVLFVGCLIWLPCMQSLYSLCKHFCAFLNIRKPFQEHFQEAGYKLVGQGKSVGNQCGM